MFAARGLFSGIKCPSNGKCNLPNCIFDHDADSDTEALYTSRERPPDGVENGEHLRNKRQKLDSTTVSWPTLILDTERQISPDEEREKPLHINDRVSPPPVRRRALQNPKPVSVTAPSGPSLKVAERTSDSTLATEKLNPRLLKSAPTSHDIRYKLIKSLHQEFVRLNTEVASVNGPESSNLAKSDQALIKMALDLEQEIATDKPTIYANILKNRILQYKRMTLKEWIIEREQERFASTSILQKSPTTNTPVVSESTLSNLTEEQAIAFLPFLDTPLIGMSQYGYVTEIPSQKAVEAAKKGVEAAKGWEICDRCKSRFQVFPGRRTDGALTSGGQCTYHWGKPFAPERDPRNPKEKRERRFRCCNEDVGNSAGCVTAETHVFKVTDANRLAAVMNFIETPPNQKAEMPAICIDGEMGYTVLGLELIRLTATRWPSGDEVFDILVRPIGEVLDLNSRFSGVSIQQMAESIPWNTQKKLHEFHIVTSPAAARDVLFSHISPSTAIIGHGLENDLNSIRLIHPSIIDSVLLFPHKAGLPYRNGLKSLTQLHLGRTIQSQIAVHGEVEGHDSREDAKAAGDLVRWKADEMWLKMKSEGWSFEAGKYTPPPPAPVSVRSGLTIEYLEQDYLKGNIAGVGKVDTKEKKIRGAIEISGNLAEKSNTGHV